jgi:hypothetical protein
MARDRGIVCGEDAPGAHFVPMRNNLPAPDSEARSRNPHPLPAYYMTDAFLGWWPILWTARWVTLILLVGGLIATPIFIVRLLHLLLAWNPRIREFGWTWKVFGQEIAGSAKLDSEQDEQLATIRRRLDELEAWRGIDRETLDATVAYLLRQQHDLFDRPDLGGSPPEAGGDAAPSRD